MLVILEPKSHLETLAAREPSLYSLTQTEEFAKNVGDPVSQIHHSILLICVKYTS